MKEFLRQPFATIELEPGIFELHPKAKGSRYPPSVCWMSTPTCLSLRRRFGTDFRRAGLVYRARVSEVSATYRDDYAFDLSGSVMAPIVKRFANPPRAQRWSEVRRILRTVDRTTRIGPRLCNFSC